MIALITKLQMKLAMYLILSLFLSGTANADNRSGISLSDVVRLTVDASPLLKQQKLLKKKQGLLKRNASQRPEVTLDFEMENFGGDGAFSGTDSAENIVALSSVIELGGDRRARSNIAEAELEAYELEVEIETLDLLGRLTELFLSGLSTQEQISVLEQHLVFLEEAFDIVKRKSDKGIAPEADLMQARVDLSMAQIKLESLKKELERKKTDISAFWGSKDPIEEKLVGDLFEFKEEVPFEDLYQQILASPFVRQLASKERLYHARVKLEKASSWANVEWSIGAKKMNDVEETAFVAGLSLPIFSGTRNRHNLEIARIDSQAYSMEEEAQLSLLYSQLFKAYSLRADHIETFETLSREVIPALESALLAVRNGYENGRYRYADLVRVQEQLIHAKQMKIERATQASYNQVMIEQLIGISINP